MRILGLKQKLHLQNTREAKQSACHLCCNWICPLSPRYFVQLGSQAKKYIQRLDKPSRNRFAEQLKEIEKDPLGSSGPLVNTKPPLRSTRVGGWRIIFSINEKDRTILISSVLPRGQSYDRI